MEVGSRVFVSVDTGLDMNSITVCGCSCRRYVERFVVWWCRVDYQTMARESRCREKKQRNVVHDFKEREVRGVRGVEIE